jgi:septal ring factor EnvC (AmiA/AmiB activator)
MNNNILLIAITAFTAGTFLLSCDRKKMEKTSESINQQLSEDSLKFVEEWESFKKTSEEKIKAREEEIQALRLKIKESNQETKEKYQQKIDTLEKKNNELKKKLSDYASESNSNAKKRWYEFKREFNHDMDELGRAFKDLTVDNTN